ncbi:unnamed protein product [Amoebophrya sp. A120]|nr:unnamed protein product [Amoebophrya sp. A120]|eukprot:GSA120T00004127001.1
MLYDTLCGATAALDLPQRRLLVEPAAMSHNTALFTDSSFFMDPMLQFFKLPDYVFELVLLPDFGQFRLLKRRNRSSTSSTGRSTSQQKGHAKSENGATPFAGKKETSGGLQNSGTKESTASFSPMDNLDEDEYGDLVERNSKMSPSTIQRGSAPAAPIQRLPRPFETHSSRFGETGVSTGNKAGATTLQFFVPDEQEVVKPLPKRKQGTATLSTLAPGKNAVVPSASSSTALNSSGRTLSSSASAGSSGAGAGSFSSEQSSAAIRGGEGAKNEKQQGPAVQQPLVLEKLSTSSTAVVPHPTNNSELNGGVAATSVSSGNLEVPGNKLAALSEDVEDTAGLINEYFAKSSRSASSEDKSEIEFSARSTASGEANVIDLDETAFATPRGRSASTLSLEAVPAALKLQSRSETEQTISVPEAPDRSRASETWKKPTVVSAGTAKGETSSTRTGGLPFQPATNRRSITNTRQMLGRVLAPPIQSPASPLLIRKSASASLGLSSPETTQIAEPRPTSPHQLPAHLVVSPWNLTPCGTAEVIDEGVFSPGNRQHGAGQEPGSSQRRKLSHQRPRLSSETRFPVRPPTSAVSPPSTVLVEDLDLSYTPTKAKAENATPGQPGDRTKTDEEELLHSSGAETVDVEELEQGSQNFMRQKMKQEVLAVGAGYGTKTPAKKEKEEKEQGTTDEGARPRRTKMRIRPSGKAISPDSPMFPSPSPKAETSPELFLSSEDEDYVPQEPIPRASKQSQLVTEYPPAVLKWKGNRTTGSVSSTPTGSKSKTGAASSADESLPFAWGKPSRAVEKLRQSQVAANASAGGHVGSIASMNGKQGEEPGAHLNTRSSFSVTPSKNFAAKSSEVGSGNKRLGDDKKNDLAQGGPARQNPIRTGDKGKEFLSSTSSDILDFQNANNDFGRASSAGSTLPEKRSKSRFSTPGWLKAPKLQFGNLTGGSAAARKQSGAKGVDERPFADTESDAEKKREAYNFFLTPNVAPEVATKRV